MWDQRYSEAGFAYGDTPNDFLAEQAGAIPAGGPVLALADGEGRNGVFLARRGHDVTAVDLSVVGLAKARELAGQHGVPLETVHADLAHFEIGEQAWDGIVSVWCHLPPEVRRALHRKVVAGLKPGGVLILEAYTPDQIALGTGGPPVPEMMMTLAGLEQELAGLDFEVAQERVRDIHEGKYHRGRSAVVQVVARKPA